MLVLGLAVAGSVRAAEPPSWQTQGLVSAGELTEASGLAASRRQPGLLWTHNDSGHAPVLYGLGVDGRLRERVAVQATAGDWEDIAAFEWQGRPHLAIADTGDNLAWRRRVQILLLVEPEAGARTVAVERILQLRFPQGPRDVEAIAVDERRGQILLLEKRVPPAELYAVDLDGPDEQLARRIGVMADTGASARGWKGRDLATAMVLHPNGRELIVMTYLRVLRFIAAASGDWGAALAAGPQASVPLPRDQRLYEALTVDADGAWWALSEGERPPLLRRPPEITPVD